jgi:hypothetical protein
MKMLQSIALSLLMGMGIAAHAVDQDVQVDILMSKIINAQKEGRAADALPSMAKLESMEPTLRTPLPESFHYLYITALDETGDHSNALRRANLYVEKFGKRGKNYSKVVDIIGRLEDVVAGETKEANDRAEADRARLKDEQEGRSPYCKQVANKIHNLNEEEKTRGSREVFKRVNNSGVDPTRGEIARWGIGKEYNNYTGGYHWTCCEGGAWREELNSAEGQYSANHCTVSY